MYKIPHMLSLVGLSLTPPIPLFHITTFLINAQFLRKTYLGCKTRDICIWVSQGGAETPQASQNLPFQRVPNKCYENNTQKDTLGFQTITFSGSETVTTLTMFLKT